VDKPIYLAGVHTVSKTLSTATHLKWYNDLWQMEQFIGLKDLYSVIGAEKGVRQLLQREVQKAEGRAWGHL
jgi:hypothetical protein